MARSPSRDPDLEQAWLRVAISGIGLLYVLALILQEGDLTSGLTLGLVASSGSILVGTVAIWWLRRSREHVIALRYVAIASDNLALTVGMAGAGEAGIAMIGVYLWVTIGNGFRFGPRYLLISYWLSLIGFGSQLLLVPFWAQHRMIGMGLLISGAIVPLYVLVLLIRLTAQKEAAEQLSNAKSRFVANVSHELRTPLTGVFAVVDLLRARKLPPDDRELVGMLGNAVKTLKSSVDAVLQMSKLEAGAERAEVRLFNLWFFVRQIESFIRPQSVAKRIGWSLQIDPRVPATVVGDPTHLAHVLGNLLNNAFKFTPSGSVALRVMPGAESRVRFEVSDTGIGIPLAQQEHLFERFVQVDGSATRRFGGTGLGASIAHDLTELMGGKIGVASAPGQGSTFWVEVPLTKPDVTAAEAFGPARDVAIVFAGSPQGSSIPDLVRSLGLDVTIVDGSACDVATLDGSRHLALLLVMNANDAADLMQSMSRAYDSPTWPIVVLTACSPKQHASLVAAGASALLDVDPDPQALRVALASLVHRLETPDDVVGPAPRRTGVVGPLDVLLADDNVSNQLLLARILQNAGHTVRTAATGAAAFDAMADDKLDLAIVDLNIPDMSGPDVIALHRASSVGARKLPIIVLSADATPAAKQQSLDAGADEFVTKPVTAATLLATIERVVAGHAARGENDRPPPADGRSSGKTVPLIDPERLVALSHIARGDAQFLATYVAASFTELEQALGDLRVAARDGDIRAARDAMHIIEGTGSSLGATALVDNCKSMRSHIAAPGAPGCAAALAGLSTTYALTKSAIQAAAHARPQSGFSTRSAG